MDLNLDPGAAALLQSHRAVPAPLVLPSTTNLAISAHLANLMPVQQQQPIYPQMQTTSSGGAAGQVEIKVDLDDNTEYSDDVGFNPEDIDLKGEASNNKSDNFYYEFDAASHPGQQHRFLCPQCNAALKSKSLLRTHVMVVHDKARRLFCRYCNYANTFQCLVESHSNAHHTRATLYECQVESCDFETHSRWKYNNHRRRHSGKYLCFYCDGAFATADRNALEMHVAAAHARQFLFACDLCSHAASTKSALNVHVRHAHQRLRDYACGFCGLQFPMRVNLVNHVNVAHAANKVWYKCEQCEYRAEKRGYVRKHVKTVHAAVKPFQCDHCPYATSFRSDLKNHVNSRHTRERMFPCEQCSYQATTKHSLRSHVRNCHETSKHLRCHICSYTTPYKKALAQHVSKYHASVMAAAATGSGSLYPMLPNQHLHHVVPEATRMKMERVAATPDISDDHVRKISEDAGCFHCIDCNFVAGSREILKTHCQHAHPVPVSSSSQQSSEFGEVPCPHCSHIASTKQSLRKHLFYVHDKIKNYSCKYCSYSSSGKSHVLKHVNAVHLKTVTFSCLLCDYRTTTKASLNKHVRAVHDKVKAFSCSHCDYKSSSSSCLKNHVNTAHLKLVFSCDKCDFQTHSTYAIKRHKKLKHGEGAPEAGPGNSGGGGGQVQQPQQQQFQQVPQVNAAAAAAALMMATNQHHQVV